MASLSHFTPRTKEAEPDGLDPYILELIGLYATGPRDVHRLRELTVAGDVRVTPSAPSPFDPRPMMNRGGTPS